MKIHFLEFADQKNLAELQPEGWHCILPYFDYYLTSPYCFPVKVIDNNEIVGIGTSIIHQDTSWLAHIIVRPEYRNRGIGQKITQALVDHIISKNCKTIYLIATDLGAPVYEKVGFETETEYLFFKDLNFDFPNSVSKNIEPFHLKFRKPIISLDKQISGENRFTQLENHLIHAYVYQVENIIEGYYLPTLGEGLIIANNAVAGIELMKLRLTKNTTAAFPIDNLSAVDFLLQKNCKEFKRAKRMKLGIKRPWQPAKIYNRIGGNIG